MNIDPLLSADWKLTPAGLWTSPTTGHAMPMRAALAIVAYKQAEGEEAVLGWVRNGLVTCSEIAEEMGTSQGTVAKLATQLIKAGKLRKSGRGYALADYSTAGNDDEE